MKFDNLFKLKGQKSNNTENKNIINIVDLLEKIENLLNISDRDWAYYEFSKDPIGNKFTDVEKEFLIDESNSLVDNMIKEIQFSKGFKDIYSLANKMNMKLERPIKPVGEAHITFAIYEEPDKIFIFQDTINKFNDLVQKSKKLQEILNKINLEELILAHELFHVIEINKKETIFTQTYKKNLWKLGPFENNSKIIAISEYSARLFSKKLLNIDISPYILDFLFLYVYNVQIANNIYDDMILKLNKDY